MRQPAGLRCQMRAYVPILSSLSFQLARPYLNTRSPARDAMAVATPYRTALRRGRGRAGEEKAGVKHGDRARKAACHAAIMSGRSVNRPRAAALFIAETQAGASVCRNE